MIIYLLDARLCLSIYVLLSAAQFTYAGWKRNPTVGQDIDQFGSVDQASAAVGATPPNNAVVPVLGPPNDAVVPATGPTNVPIAIAGAAGVEGVNADGSPAVPSVRAGCKACQCNCPISFGRIINQAVVMAQPAQSTLATLESVVVVQGSAKSATLQETVSASSILVQTSSIPAVTTKSTAVLSSTPSTPSTVSARASLTAKSSSSSTATPFPEVTIVQSNVAPAAATPPASTAQVIIASGQYVPVVADYSTFQFQSAVTVPLKARRAIPTAAAAS